jgi:DNA-binding sugar fermentation-stimulating protein
MEVKKVDERAEREVSKENWREVAEVEISEVKAEVSWEERELRAEERSSWVCVDSSWIRSISSLLLEIRAFSAFSEIWERFKIGRIFRMKVFLDYLD